jgi:hypothetical protein
MTSRLGDRLHAARRRRFVGRDAERALFQATLAAPDLPFCLLYLYGPGGVGKTTLLKEFEMLCAEGGVAALRLDGRNIDPTPAAFVAALQAALGLAAEAAPLEEIAARGGRHALFIDTYELLAPLDTWLRDDFLPQAPDNLLVALAGRRAPAAGWGADPGWRDMIRVMPLRNLSAEESRAYLSRCQIPPAQHVRVLDFTHGHPLALSLVADVFAQRGDFDFQPEAAPDVVKALLEDLVQKAPGPAHRTALEACALVRLMTEDLLDTMLAMPDTHELFEWLRGLSFMEAGALGLFPHDLAREALAADLRWRNPAWYAELHRRARNYYLTGLQKASERDQQRILFDYVFLHRDNPVMKPFFEWQESGSVPPDRLRPADREPLIAMVESFEGPESAAIAAHWLDRQPEGAIVFRDLEGAPTAFMLTIALEKAAAADFAMDPGAGGLWRYVQTHAPLRPGETAIAFRFWMARDTYQSVSPTQSMIAINTIRYFMTTPGLAFSFSVLADAEFWTPVFLYSDQTPIPEAGFVVGGRHYTPFGHNWRAVPPLAWLALLAEREVTTMSEPPPPSPVTTRLVVLSEDRFTEAVRDALRDFTRPDALRHNPLLLSRLVVDKAGASARPDAAVSALQALIRQACARLEAAPQDAKLYRALHATYLRPAPTQEAAAEQLDLPFSTYRRHLKSGLTRVAEILWQWEIQGPGA